MREKKIIRKEREVIKNYEKKKDIDREPVSQGNSNSTTSHKTIINVYDDVSGSNIGQEVQGDDF